MKLYVVVDSNGVVGTARAGRQQLEDGSEIEFGLSPLAGQTLHEVDVEDSFAELSVDALHARVGQMVRVQNA